jgi:hypothetical protein
LAAVLHLAGDVIGLYSNVPKTISEELKSGILNTLSMIFAEAKEQVVQCVDQAMSIDAFAAPLEPEFENEVIFGVPLKETLRACLNNQAEEHIANSHFQVFDEEELGGEDDGDDEII